MKELKVIISLLAASFIISACGGNKGGTSGLDGLPVDASKPVVLKIISPKSDEILQTNVVSVEFTIDNYILKQDPNMKMGNHVHIILDGKDYVPVYDASKPYLELGELKEGTHVLRMFPSRPWHESWKNPEAFAAVVFHVKKKSRLSPIDLSRPIFTYSRPKGENVGEMAKKVIFDFWLSNVSLSSNGNRLRYVLDNKTNFLYKWEPVYFENLANGEHVLRVALVDSTGKLIKNGWNLVEKKFSIKK